MNLSTLAQARAETGRPVRAALIGAGKFGCMFLAQAPHIAGLSVTHIGPGPRPRRLPRRRLVQRAHRRDTLRG